MKCSRRNIRRLLSAGLIILFLFTIKFSLSAAEQKRIALLPFKINSEKDLSFLKDGIFDMLSTRLAKEDRVEVIERTETEAVMQSTASSERINEAVARDIGTRLNADFVLFGSLTVLGDNVSIDAKMVDITGAKPTMTFYDQSQDLGAVITKINLIAADIKIAVGSNGPRAKMDITLRRTDLMDRLFPHIYSARDLNHPKPAPDVYLKAAELRGVEPRNTVVIEDSASGARAAVAAGMPCFGFVRETPAERLQAHCDVLFYEIDGLPGLLGI